MSRYAQGEPKIKEVRNAEFLSSLIVASPEKSSGVESKKSSKKQKKK